MRTNLLLTKALVAVVLLLGGVSSVWAETTLYEKGTTGHAWAVSDLDDWTFAGSDGQEIKDSGLRFYKSTVARTEYTSTHSLSTSADYIVTMNLLWNVENANGSGTAGCYVKFGDVTLFWCGQNRDLKITIGSTETTLISGAGTDLRGTDFNVEISINKKTNDVNYSISNTKYNSGTPITGSGSSTTGDVSSVIFGWWRGGQQNASSQIVKSIVITEEEYTASTANYTVHFVDNNSVTVKEDDVRTGEVGVDVGASAGDKLSFILDDNKYVYSSDGGGTTITSNGEAEFTVTYTKYVSTDYAVKAQVSGEDLTTLSSGTAYFDGSTTEYWSKYINESDQWYVADEATCGATITAATTNIAFTATDEIDYFFEFEDMTISRSFSALEGDTRDTRASNGIAKTLYGDANAVTKTTVAAGIYTINVNGIKWDNKADNYEIAYSADGINWTALGNISYAASEEGVKTLENAIIPTEAYIRIWTTQGSQTPRRYLDYITLKKTADIPATIAATTGANGFTTFASEYPLDLANLPEGLKAYTATLNGTTLTFVECTQAVAAGTGLLLEGTADMTYDIPVVADGATITDNALTGVTAVTPLKSDDTKYIFAMRKATSADDPLSFAPLTSESEVNFPAGKAYIKVEANKFESTARALVLTFDDATSVKELKNSRIEELKSYYNLNGQRVSQPSKGLYIVNGKKVVIK